MIKLFTKILIGFFACMGIITIGLGFIIGMADFSKTDDNTFSYEIFTFLNKIIYSGVGCEGIEKYENFTLDEMKDLIEIKSGKNYKKRMGAISPYDFLIKNEKGDCETIAHTLSCFCDMKNITYRYYNVGHVGIKVKEFEEWESIS